LTQYHRYEGKIPSRGHRLADLLNDTTTEVLEMRDVRVSQPGNGLSSPLNCQNLQLRKDSIILTIPTGTYEAPTKRLYSYIEKQHYLAHIMLPGCQMIGTMHLPDRVNRWQLLCQDSTTPSFVPITNVIVQFAFREYAKFQRRVVIFRRHLIEALSISERPLAPTQQAESGDVLRLDPEELAREFAEIQGENKGPGPSGRLERLKPDVSVKEVF
jgi:hypothetical protein